MRPTALLFCGMLLIAAIGCSRSETSPPANSSAIAQPAPPVDTPPATVTKTPLPQVAKPLKSTPIASADSNIEGVRVEVTQLKRIAGGIVDLRFTFINDSDRDLGPIEVQAFVSPGPWTIQGVTLIDPLGKKKYFVATDSENRCVCNGFEALKRGSHVNVWARFPAPPDGVERMAIMIPGVAPIDDVPLSR